MTLQSLRLKDFRNLSSLHIEAHPRCNVFVGENGQGKTSIMEAIYLLSRGQSFRTHVTSSLIKFHSNALAVQAATSAGERILLQKDAKGTTKIFLNEKRCQRASELSMLLPCQIFYQDLFHIIDASSQIRRKLLDWGVFYAMPEYLTSWQSFKRALLQRNALLKQRASHESLRVWDQAFVAMSAQVTIYRERYFDMLQQVFNTYIAKLPHLDCQIRYFNGWQTAKDAQSKDLDWVLQQQEAIDRKLLYTHSGPQHADVLFLTQQGKGKVEWSRGQQKLILILLKLAQASLLQRPCIYLLDDLAAELDSNSIQHVYNQLAEASGQFFITTLDDHAKQHPFFANSRWFYLQDGHITQVVDV